MTDTTMLAPTGTTHTFLASLGITDIDAVHSVDIDSVGVITVKVRLRGPDGNFLYGTHAESPLPVIMMATLRFAEVESDYEPLAEWEKELIAAGTLTPEQETRVIQAYNTDMAFEALDVTTSGNADKWRVVSDEGERGRLRTFTFVKHLP